MGRLLAVAVLLVGLAGGLRGSPFLHLRSGTTTGSNAEEIALYAGPVDSCEVPATHTCGVDYEVPSSVARVAEAVERYINLTYSEDFDLVYSAACGNATRRIVCSQRFPRCVTGTDGEKQVVFSSLQCELELRDNCGTQAGSFVDMLTSKLCSVEDSTSDVGECKSVLQYATDRGETGQFGYCVLSEDWKVTEWMYQYLKYFDQAAQALVQVTSYPQLCAKKLANFTCQSVGRCSESMESVQLINTRQLCEQAVSCFTDLIATKLQERYNCDFWPEAPTAPSTSPTASTITSTPKMTGDSGASTMATWPSPPDVSDTNMFEGGGAALITGSVWTLALAITVTVLTLYHH